MDKGLDIASIRFRLAAHATLYGRPQELAALLREPARSASRALDWSAVDRTLDWAERAGVTLLFLGEPAYPPQLAAIPDPPPLLYVRGDPAVLSAPQLAIVGSRRATPDGEETAFAFARDLAARGLAITSGLARGIDAAAHRGTLAAGGVTVAVFGSGLGRVYPQSHRKLAALVCERGAAVSEYPPTLPPLPYHFPRRNRIVSGLALGTLVVQAAPTSGSLVTAQHALEQGRDVYAVPGSIHDPNARGCHALLRQGATLVESTEDLVAELPAAVRAHLAPGPASTATPEPVTAAEATVAGACGFAPTSFDSLLDRTGLTAQQVSSILMALEIKGRIRSLPGGNYVRTGETRRAHRQPADRA